MERFTAAFTAVAVVNAGTTTPLAFDRRPSAAHPRPSAFGRFALASLLTASALANAQLRPSQPEPPSGWTPKKLATAKKYMVAAAHPLAVDAGVRMLERGGSAIDAMVATQLVLNLVEPASSGLGGGAYLMYWDAKRKAIRAYDARETAPEAASAQLFVKADGKPMSFLEGRVGGRAVGTPGTPRLLEVAHARHGRLPWAELFQPAIEIAERGFAVTPRFHKLASEDKGLADEPAARRHFFDEAGNARAVGTIVRNPEFAAVLRAMARGGADAFYRGEIARDIVAAVRGHRNAGTLSEADLAGYKVRDVEPLCGKHRQWKLCGMPPSSSGGVAVLQILGVLAAHDVKAMRPGSTQAVHYFSEAGRLAFADRGRYLGDDRFVDVPLAGLADRSYVASRAAMVRPERSLGVAQAGVPAGVKTAHADDAMDEAMGTSHISIVDAQGNAVSMTTTIEANFGSRLMVRGFLLNNQLTDFNFLPLDGNAPAANAVAPGKRPRSSMAPFLVFDDASGAFEMTVGSPGGSLIINYVAKTLVGTLDWGLDPQAAIDLPNFGSRNGPTEIERGTELEALQASLKAIGHDVRVIDMTSGVQAIRRTAHGLQGGADPRREGVARGR